MAGSASTSSLRPNRTPRATRWRHRRDTDGWRAVRSRPAAALADRLPEVSDEIVDRFDAHREPNETGRRRELRATDRAVGHGKGDLDQRFDAAERLGQREDLGPSCHPFRRDLAPAQLEGE